MRRARKLRELAEESAQTPKLLTLTYQYADAGWIDQGAIRRFMNALRTHVRRLGYAVDYIWTAEVQERYSLHYHVVIIGSPFLPKGLLESWWGHGFVDVRAISAKEATEHAVSYAEKGVGRDEPADLVRHVMHSAFKLRRFGCSRRVSAKLELIPRWLMEWAALHGADLDLCDWEVDPETNRCYVFYEGEVVHSFRFRSVSWRILTELSNCPTPSRC
jgi:hypothetical protein